MAKRGGFLIGERPGIFKDEVFDVNFIRTLGYDIYGGATAGECFAVTPHIRSGDFESWTLQWSALAKRLETMAQVALQEGRLLTARSTFLRAYNYYRTSEFFVYFEDPRKRELYHHSRACFAEAAKLFNPPFETVAIPYTDTTLPGYFLRPANDDQPRPTIIMLGGGDASGEELYFLTGGAAALERGYNALIFHGPGQRGALHQRKDLIFRHDYEAVITPVVNFVLKQRGVDVDRVALYAISLGGYLGARAAVFEHRLAALILNSPMPNFYEYNMAGIRSVMGPLIGLGLSQVISLAAKFIPLARFSIETYKWIFGGQTVAEVFERMEAYQLRGLEREIRCPTLCMASEGESSELQAQGERFYEALSVPKAWRMFTGIEGAAAHCQHNNLALSHQVMLDWLDATLLRRKETMQ
jgi:pimeloyl-ACP methyl ester carboxylesterase